MWLELAAMAGLAGLEVPLGISFLTTLLLRQVMEVMEVMEVMLAE
jgi:hypothetical protein